MQSRAVCRYFISEIFDVAPSAVFPTSGRRWDQNEFRLGVDYWRMKTCRQCCKQERLRARKRTGRYSAQARRRHAQVLRINEKLPTWAETTTSAALSSRSWLDQEIDTPTLSSSICRHLCGGEPLQAWEPAALNSSARDNPSARK